MTLAPHSFYLPDDMTSKQLLAALDSLGNLRVLPPENLLRSYYDTFDWRLHAAGGYLLEEQQNQQIRTCWRRIVDHQLLGQMIAAAPRYPAQRPPGPLRDALAKLTDMRTLLPVARLELRVDRATLLNKQGKTVLRCTVEAGKTVDTENSADRALPSRLCLEQVKGYPKPYAKALVLVQEQLKLEPAGPQLEEVLALAGRKPQDYSSKLEVELQPAMPAGEALRILLHHLLITMERNLAGTRQDLDSEFLHDFRVAVRRTRSLLSQVKGVIPPAVASHFAAEFKWLGQITGATRDLDVYLLKLPGYRAGLPDSMQEDLQPLQDYLVRHQQLEQRKLARQLASVRCRRLLDEWRRFLTGPPDKHSWPEKAVRPILEVANRKSWKTYRLVLDEGLLISENSPAAALHELRIRCKKLRYLMEFFQSLHPAELVSTQIKTLKGLQDVLGDFHDLEVQADALRDFGRDMQAELPDLPGEVFMAMGVLIDSLYKRQAIERQNFSGRFARFARPANRKICHELFKPSAPNKETP
ncbi:MAG: CHAD domain-containing protein [Desulfuromonadales bacterium]|nr:CHAD domain-containing protein [Desulfuromonadales bacterium]